MIRSATPEDLHLVSTWVRTARECELWAGWRVRFPLQLDALSTSIDFAHHGGLVLTDEEALIAFGQVVPKAQGRAHLARLIVAPAHRGRGVGQTLVASLLDGARASGFRVASLNVDPSNAPAIHVYAKLGFCDAPRPVDEPDPHGSRYMQRQL